MKSKNVNKCKFLLNFRFLVSKHKNLKAILIPYPSFKVQTIAKSHKDYSKLVVTDHLSELKIDERSDLLSHKFNHKLHYYHEDAQFNHPRRAGKNILSSVGNTLGDEMEDKQ